MDKPKVAVITGGARGIGIFITGQDIIVDGGMTKMMVYHKDCGWTYRS